MSITSTMLPLGTIAPDFALTDVVSGEPIRLHDSKSYPATVIMFICNHCPYVKHVNSELTRIANDYLKRGIRFIAINSNDVDKYPADSPDNMCRVAQEEGYPFPYLFDETQQVAKAYQAACTPDFYIFDAHYALVYRGQLDDSRPKNNLPVNGNSLRAALDSILDNKPVAVQQIPSLGCNIKWKE